MTIRNKKQVKNKMLLSSLILKCALVIALSHASQAMAAAAEFKEDEKPAIAIKKNATPIFHKLGIISLGSLSFMQNAGLDMNDITHEINWESFIVPLNFKKYIKSNDAQILLAKINSNILSNDDLIKEPSALELNKQIIKLNDFFAKNILISKETIECLKSIYDLSSALSSKYSDSVFSVFWKNN